MHHDSAEVPEWGNASRYQTTLSRDLYPSRISTIGPCSDFRARAAVRRIGSLAMIEAHANAAFVLHRLALKDDDDFVLHLQLTGRSVYRHRSGSTDCAPDTLVLTQPRSVITAEQLTAADAIVVKIPGVLVRSTFRNIDECCWKATHARAGCADILRNFILGLWSWSESLGAHDHRMLPLSLISLMQSVFHTARGGSDARDNERLYRSLQQEIAVRLQDENLSAEELARALGVSRSRLYALTNFAGTTVEKLIIDMRLDRVARSLVDETHAGVSITDLALEAGFRDLSHFSHRFKQKYGRPPSAYRALARPGS